MKKKADSKVNYDDIVSLFNATKIIISNERRKYVNQCFVSPSIYDMGIKAAKEKKDGFRRVGRGLYWGKCKVIKSKWL